MEADLSAHFGRSGEFFIGLFGLALLALMHKDARRLARNWFGTLGRTLQSFNSALARNIAFYRDWASAIHLMFRGRRDLFVIIFAMTAFDYIAGWHADFMVARFNLTIKYESYDAASVFAAYILSAPYVLTLLRFAGYTLFCWLAYRTAAGASYREASTFRPFAQLAGLFLCIYGVEAIGDTITPYLFFSISQIGDDILFVIVGTCIGFIGCVSGLLLLTARRNGARFVTASSAILGYLLATHLLQWMYFLLSRGRSPNNTPWVEFAEYYASNFTYTLLWNMALVAFAVRLSGPPQTQSQTLGHAANTV